MATITMFEPAASLGHEFSLAGEAMKTVCLFDAAPGGVQITDTAARCNAIHAVFRGATAVDLNNIPALRTFIRDNAARAGLGVFEREVME